MKKLLVMVLCLAMVFTVVACAAPAEAPAEVAPADAPADAPAEAPAEEPAEEPAPAGDETFRIGYSINSMNDTWQTYLAADVEAGVTAMGMEFDIQDAQEDPIMQQDQINNMITNGADALVVIAVDTTATDPIIDAAASANIPLIFVNRNPFGENEPPANTFYTGVDEPVAGQMQAEYIAQISDGGGVVVLQGMLSNDGAIKRTEGFLGALDPKFTHLQTEVADWSRDLAITAMDNMLTAHGDTINVVVANNDEMALGAINALESAGRTDVIVMGIDGTPDALEAIEAGTMVGSVFQSSELMAEQAVAIVDKALKGEAQEAVQHVDWALITPENVAEFK